MSLEIRELVAPDVDQLPDPITSQAAELLVAKVLGDASRPADLDEETFIRYLGHEHRRGYAVVDGPLVLAAIAIELAPDYTFITAIATRSDHLRQGHGSALIRHIAKETIANDTTGENKITLYADTPVPEFYEKLGFETRTDEDGYTDLAADPRDIVSR